MEVGPSAEPMTPIAAASFRLKPNRVAAIMVKKMPNWAAAPNSSSMGLRNRGLKSIMAPMAMKISSGKISVRMPARKNRESAPTIVWPPSTWSRTEE